MALTLRTDIPYGNAALVETTETAECCQISFTPDTHNGLERLWFCFRLENDSRNTPAKTQLRLKHYENTLGGNWDSEQGRTIQPVIRYENGSWERLPHATPEPTPDGRLTLFWEIDTPATFAEVAVCYPYGLPELETLINDCDGYWQQDEIGVSQGGNPLIRLSNNYGEADSQAPGLYLMARQHSGEVGGGWVLDGMLRHLAENKVNNLTVWCAPLANIDGVLDGDYGKNPFPHDLNRAWSLNAPMRHEVLTYMRDLLRWKQRCNPFMVVDSHCPCINENCGVYTFVVPGDEGNREVNNRLDVIGKHLDEYASEDFTKVSYYKAKSTWGEHPMLREFVGEHLNIQSISFETPYMQIRGKTLTIESYQDIGRRIATAILELIDSEQQ